MTEIQSFNTLENDNLFLQLLDEGLTDAQKKMYTDSFSAYMKYDQNTEFVVDLDDHWKEIGYSQKIRAVEAIEKNLEENTDYSHEIFAFSPKKANNASSSRGGNNIKKIYLTVTAFKNLCMLAGTEEGKRIRKYYVAIEGITHKYYDIQLQATLELSNQVQQLQIQSQAQLEQLESQIQSQHKIIVQKDIELAKNVKKLKEAKVENLEQWYYIYDVSPGKVKGGISTDLEDTLRTYRRCNTNTDFFWTWKFINPKFAAEIESIIRDLAFRYREKSNPKTEIFNLEIGKFQKLAYTIIKIFDNPESNISKELDHFLDIFEEIKDSKADEILKKLEELRTTYTAAAANIPAPAPNNIINITNPAPVTPNNIINIPAPVTPNNIINIPAPVIFNQIPRNNRFRNTKTILAELRKLTPHVPIQIKEDGRDTLWRCQFPDCDEENKKLSAIEKHIKSTAHLDYRPEECDVCHLRFMDESTLNSHKDAQHLNPMIWHCIDENCDLFYSHVDSLRKHLKDVHSQLDIKLFNLKDYAVPRRVD